MLTHGKLVRNFIPDMIQESGRTPVYRTLSDEEYRESLHVKLLEEVSEYIASEEVMELADILEVIHALLETQGVTPSEIEELRLFKARERGTFSDKIFLEEVLAEDDDVEA